MKFKELVYKGWEKGKPNWESDVTLEVDGNKINLIGIDTRDEENPVIVGKSDMTNIRIEIVDKSSIKDGDWVVFVYDGRTGYAQMEEKNLFYRAYNLYKEEARQWVEDVMPSDAVLYEPTRTEMAILSELTYVERRNEELFNKLNNNLFKKVKNFFYTVKKNF